MNTNQTNSPILPLPPPSGNVSELLFQKAAQHPNKTAIIIPSKEGDIPSTNTTPLNELEINTKGKVMGVTLDDKAFLDYLTKLNISIGTYIEIIEKISFDKSISIKIKNISRHISNDVAKHLLVKIK